jgi:hypothetical protein
MDNSRIYKGNLFHKSILISLDLESLDQIIYKEGRVKRNRQNLLDSMLSKLKDTTEQYDKLFSILVNIEKKYKELMRYGRDVCPEALQGVKLKDTKKIAYFKNNEKLYERAIKLNMLK